MSIALGQNDHDDPFGLNAFVGQEFQVESQVGRVDARRIRRVSVRDDKAREKVVFHDEEPEYDIVWDDTGESILPNLSMIETFD
ncbi:MAG: hypothetical protein ACXADL_09765 [Candidatus Thorarchaeota archaeon]|jgi:hypothetical protein